jgi:hypothetical protein
LLNGGGDAFEGQDFGFFFGAPLDFDAVLVQRARADGDA